MTDGVTNGAERVAHITPNQRHFGEEQEILQYRAAVYERAKRKKPERWARNTRDWTPAGPVQLNPVASSAEAQARRAAA